MTGKRHEEGETKEEGARYINLKAGARSLLPVISPLESRNTSRPSRKKKDRPGYSIPRKRSQKKTLNRENKGELNHDKDRTYIRVLLSTVELSLHPLSSHEVESVRKEKERLTAASAALFLSALNYMMTGSGSFSYSTLRRLRHQCPPQGEEKE